MNIFKASLLLSINVNVDSFNIENGHLSFNCTFVLDENSAEISDDLPELESCSGRHQDGTRLNTSYISQLYYA